MYKTWTRLESGTNQRYSINNRVYVEKKFIPLEPQPNEDVVVECHRPFAKLNTDEDYKRRVTVLTKLPANHKDKESIAIVVYQGL